MFRSISQRWTRLPIFQTSTSGPFVPKMPHSYTSTTTTEIWSSLPSLATSTERGLRENSTGLAPETSHLISALRKVLNTTNLSERMQSSLTTTTWHIKAPKKWPKFGAHNCWQMIKEFWAVLSVFRYLRRTSLYVKNWQWICFTKRTASQLWAHSMEKSSAEFQDKFTTKFLTIKSLLRSFWGICRKRQIRYDYGHNNLSICDIINH